MEQVIQFLIANPAIALMILTPILDTIRGALPNSWKGCKGKGLTLPMLTKIFKSLATASKTISDFDTKKVISDK